MNSRDEEATAPLAQPAIRSRAVRCSARGLSAVAFTIAIVLLLLALGTFVPSLPGLGAIGSMLLPTVAPQALIAAVVAIIAAIGALVLVKGKLKALVVVLSLLALVGVSTIFGSQLHFALESGVSVSPIMWSLEPVSAGAPDRSVAYMVDDYGSELQMDIYEPGEAAERSPSGVPIMVYVHGGGWVSGTPAETAATLRWFSEQGYLVISPEYTLATADRATWDIAMPQVTCALAWVGQQAAELGGDPSRIAVLGGSAGANLALTATYAAADTQQALPCKGDVPKISAVVGLVPAVDPESVFNNTDPVMKGYDQQLVRAYLGGEPADHPNRVKAVQVGTYLSPLVPPTLIVGHKNDHIVPIAGIRDFVDRARDAGIDVTYKEVIWADHTTPLLNYNPVSQALRLQVLDFIRARGL